jgi:hypothetical protein
LSEPAQFGAPRRSPAPAKSFTEKRFQAALALKRNGGPKAAERTFTPKEEEKGESYPG